MDTKFRVTPNFLLWTLCIALSSCGTRDGLAPMMALSGLSMANQNHQHIVVRGETLYAIAFRYDVDFQQLVSRNHLQYPYHIRIGQTLYLQGPIKNPVIKQTVQKQQIPIQKYHATANQWLWPMVGQVQTSFLPQQGRKGLDIIGRRGDKIHASSNGVVAYAGNGLNGYGNLIIIKHDNHYLTAYGNNSRNLVREGQLIKAGQVIAIIGPINRQNVGVHFEIRKGGEPVNPMNYLGKMRS